MLQSKDSGALPPTPPTRGAAAGRRRWGRLLAATASVGLHAAILFMILFPFGRPPLLPPDPPPVVVQLIPAPTPPAPEPPAPTPAPPAPKVVARAHPTKSTSTAHAAARRPVALASLARRSNAVSSPLAASDEQGDDSEVSEAELAGAASAGGGGGGGGSCDMVARLQAALRKDTIVRSAVASLAGRAVRVWNGDWVKSNGEDGKGLAAVREAMMWEVAFAPPACRSEPVRGLVVMSVDSPEGRVRLALGEGQWRWSDLLATAETGVGGSLR